MLGNENNSNQSDELKEIEVCIGKDYGRFEQPAILGLVYTDSQISKLNLGSADLVKSFIESFVKENSVSFNFNRLNFTSRKGEAKDIVFNPRWEVRLLQIAEYFDTNPDEHTDLKNYIDRERQENTPSASQQNNPSAKKLSYRDLGCQIS
jgi:hypothetical protein